MLMKEKKTYSVCTLGAPVLGKVAAPVEAITPEIKELAQYMVQAMHLFDGIGIAAPQVGVSKRLVVIDVPIREKETIISPGEDLLRGNMPIALVNPQIVALSGELKEYDEGCLSVPDIYAKVVRHDKALVRFTTLAGQNIEIECANLLSRCLQHEIDHLDGLLFTDRLSPDERRRVEKEIALLAERGARNNYLRIKKKK